MPSRDNSPFTDEELTIHGYHDDRRVLIAQTAATICGGLVANFPKLADLDEFLRDKKARQNIADCAIDLALRILQRISSEPEGAGQPLVDK